VVELLVALSDNIIKWKGQRDGATSKSLMKDNGIITNSPLFFLPLYHLKIKIYLHKYLLWMNNDYNNPKLKL